MHKTTYLLSTKKAFVSQQNLFSEEILKNSFIFEFENNEFIHHEGTKIAYLFYILEGKGKILKTEENGKRLILQFIKSGDFIGELSLIKAEERAKDVLAIGETVCLGIPMAYAETVLLNDVAFLQDISRYIGEKLLFRMEHFAMNQAFELKYQLANLLLEVSVGDHYLEKHTEIAEYLGVSYRHLLHVFRLFKEQGLIEKQGKYYRIHRKELQNLLKEQQ